MYTNYNCWAIYVNTEEEKLTESDFLWITSNSIDAEINPPETTDFNTMSGHTHKMCVRPGFLKIKTNNKKQEMALKLRFDVRLILLPNSTIYGTSYNMSVLDDLND